MTGSAFPDTDHAERDGLFPVLLVADFFHPIDHLAIELFLYGDVSHRVCGAGSVPMLFTWGKPDDVTRTDLLDSFTILLHPAEVTESRIVVPSSELGGVDGKAAHACSF
jgi:hypothetical protein